MIRKIFVALLLTVMIFFGQNAFAQPHFSYRANVEGSGWLQEVGNGEVAGTVGQSRRMEALVINLDGDIKYSAHVQNIGWQNWVYAGTAAGTVGQNLRMEAIRIQPFGSTEQYFDVYYRAHVENAGWLGWAKNGEPAGTAGASLRLEALQIQLVEKNTPFERGNRPAFYQAIPNAPTV